VRDAALVVDAPGQPAVVAPPPVAIDAAVPHDAPRPGYIVVHTDAWCDVSIDGAPRGRASARPIEVAAGTHTVACTQGAIGSGWTTRVIVAPGATVEASGSVLEVEITFAVDATVNGTAYRAG
jgi:hypothetical protein